jgi:hypothetical protein
MKQSALIAGKDVTFEKSPFLFLFAFLLFLMSSLCPFVGTARADLQGTDGLVRLSSPEIASPGTWSVGLFGSYYRRMSPTAHSVTENFAVGNLSGRYGLTKLFEAFAVLPGNGTLWQYKKLPDRDEQSVNHGGLGDARLGFKMKMPFESETYGLGFEAVASFPTGSNTELWLPDQPSGQKLFTSGSTNLSGRVCASVDLSGVEALSPLKLVADVGYWFNGEKDVVRFPSYLFPIPGSLANKDVIFGGLALVIPTPSVTLFTELYTEQFVQGSEVAARKENPIFVTPGAKVRLPFGLVATAAVDIRLSMDDLDTAFNPDEAFPEWGVTVGLDFTPTAFTEDTDGDGTPDRLDRCPTAPGPKANDGCPDTIRSVQPAEKRPVQPAQVQPVQPAQTQPVQPTQVQPAQTQPVSPSEAKPAPSAEIDTDHDGIPDSRDKCPTLAEDIDGYEDDDGCPEIDSDGDGIPDAIDKCPTVPGPKSNNGCPK